MKKIVAMLVIVAIPVLYFLYAYRNDMPLIPRVTKEDGYVARVGNVPIRVEVADTGTSRSKGLGGPIHRWSEPPHHGIAVMG